ncbi:MAG TPA: tetratricopeptide repeat protein [Candidatus Udaeobacter sp.]|nr:tetratricopeptide repeat protein [Candidatus Udaeobacter sp.]
MASRIPIVLTLIFFFLVTSYSQAAEPSARSDDEPATGNLLQEAQTLAKAKKPQAAIEKCNKVIAAFETAYRNKKEKFYCAHTSAETLGYLVMAAAGNNRGKGPGTARVVSATWSDAYYLKGYALIELGKTNEAKAALQHAVALSPWYSQYLNELGHVYQSEKNWPKAMEVFKLAEDQASLSPDEIKAFELGRARRGFGYVLVELGRLDEAEKKYKQCLATDAKDAAATRELEYVRGLQAKKKSR